MEIRFRRRSRRRSRQQGEDGTLKPYMGERRVCYFVSRFLHMVLSSSLLEVGYLNFSTLRVLLSIFTSWTLHLCLHLLYSRVRLKFETTIQDRQPKFYVHQIIQRKFCSIQIIMWEVALFLLILLHNDLGSCNLVTYDLLISYLFENN